MICSIFYNQQLQAQEKYLAFSHCKRLRGLNFITHVYFSRWKLLSWCYTFIRETIHPHQLLTKHQAKKICPISNTIFNTSCLIITCFISSYTSVLTLKDLDSSTGRSTLQILYIKSYFFTDFPTSDQIIIKSMSMSPFEW